MIIPAGYAQVTHVFGGTGLPEGAATTYGILLNGGSWDPGDAGLLHDIFGDTWLTSMSASVTLERTILKAGPNDVGPATEFSDPRTGGNVASMAPPNVSFLVRKVTAMGGRANRGRMYLPGVPESLVGNDGTLDSTFVTNQATVATNFLSRLSAEVLAPVILHNSVQTPTLITQLVMEPRVATQRRRLR